MLILIIKFNPTHGCMQCILQKCTNKTLLFARDFHFNCMYHYYLKNKDTLTI